MSAKIIELSKLKALTNSIVSKTENSKVESAPRYILNKIADLQQSKLINPQKLPEMRYKNLKIYWGADNRAAKKTGKIITDISKEWDVRYEYWNDATQKFQRIQIAAGVNRYHTIPERTKWIKALYDATLDQLQNGYNPLTNSFETEPDPNANPLADIQSLNVYDALMWAIGHKTKLESKTLQSYKSNAKYFTEALADCGFAELKISQLKRAHIKLAINKWEQNRNLGAVTKNNYLENIGTIINVLCEFEILEGNPVQFISKEKEGESTVHEPPTNDEMAAIAKALKNYDYGFYLFCQTILQTGIREKELLTIRIEHIDFTDCIIKLYPTDNSGNRTTKNAKFRLVPISEKTTELLKTFCGNLTKGYLFTVENKLVVPGDRKTHRNYITYLWKELIKDGLGIDRTLYSLKSRGNNDRKQDNKMSDDAIAFLFGHSDKGMSRKHYHRDKLGAYGDEIRRTEPTL